MANHESRDYLELATYAAEAFSNDGTLNHEEFNKMMDIVLRDGKVDNNEKRVLSNIFGRIKENELPVDLAAKIQQVRDQHGI
ncbi:hypothetical protein [Spartinivicinus poritis]|uniref:Uncharacterized protein n=1 Tax=Spartinivicinus poritis TaxID=2994640 RepID=A0ABT5UA49_9GAMM|nr:hypothetical protein [Spartinivicinus sp. A2-2]MDE1463237.1 hypothetical protein [Spartinivicinus sp. A2-2]